MSRDRKGGDRYTKDSANRPPGYRVKTPPKKTDTRSARRPSGQRPSTDGPTRRGD